MSDFRISTGKITRPLVSGLLVFLFLTFWGASAGASEDIDRRIRELVSKDHRGGVVVVLSGGGTKGFAHVGVLKILEQENIPIVGIVGTSIGSVIGGLYATGYTADELYKIIMETNIMGLLADSGTRIRPGAGDHRPMGETTKIFHKNFDKNFNSAGPLGVLPALSLVSFLTKYTGHIPVTDFNKLPIPFACVATDIGTGETVVLRDGNLASSIRASVAIPGMLEPWPLEGRLLVDGGLVANLPVAIAKDIFPGYPVIAVNLAGATIEKSNESFTGMIDILTQMIDVMTIDRLKYNESLADLLIYPDVSSFSMLDASGYDDIYQRGLAAASEMTGEIAALSACAPPPPVSYPDTGDKIVRSVRVEGISKKSAADIERVYENWIGKPYDSEKIDTAIQRISKREEVATVDIDIYPASDADADGCDVDVVFSIEKRPPYQVALDGYTSNLSSNRWMGFSVSAHDLFSEDDAASLQTAFGNEEWGVGLRYFTPLRNYKQWGFAFNARKENYEPRNQANYELERYSLRIMHYDERLKGRLGIGIAGERTDAVNVDKTSWGPYLYYQRDTLDNSLTPSSGHSFTSKIWWSSEGIWVTKSVLTAYVPFGDRYHYMLKFGLETGDGEHEAYRAMLGNQDEMFSLARHPLIGDQAAWAYIGVGNTFYNSWWGALRGEVFASYGMVMDRWDRTEDAWELGVALSSPGQFMNGKILLVYDDDGEFTFGFTLGVPRWWDSPLP